MKADFLLEIKKQVYDKCDFQVQNLSLDPEGQNYDACKFQLNGLNIIYRKARITPKKTGQFVTFWQRNEHGKTVPYTEKEKVDYFVITTKCNNELGQFVIPKTALIKSGIISSQGKAGKRGFRIYPPWDIVANKQAIKTQKWQLVYFVRINKPIDFTRVKKLYYKDSKIINT